MGTGGAGLAVTVNLAVPPSWTCAESAVIETVGTTFDKG